MLGRFLPVDTDAGYRSDVPCQGSEAPHPVLSMNSVEVIGTMIVQR